MPAKSSFFSQKRLLLIESSGSFRTTLKSMLSELGFGRVDEARPTQENLLERIEAVSYHLILLSHNFNDPVTGMQLLEEARFRGVMKPSTSWVLMTSDASQEAVLHAIDSHPDEVLTKPFSLDELQRRLQRICQRKAALEPIERAVERGALTRAVELCDSQLSRNDANYPYAQQLKGQLLLDLGDYEAARQVFERYYWEKRDMRPGYYLALCLFRLQRFQEAKQLLEELLKSYPLMIPAYELLAKVCEAHGAPEQAREVLQVAVTHSPRGVLRQQELGRLAAKTGDLETASQAYKKAIELGKQSCYDSPEPYLRLANVQRQRLPDLAGRDHQVQLRDMEQLLQRASRRFRRDEEFAVRSQLLQSRLCEDLGRAEEAEAHRQEAERLNFELETPLDLGYVRQDVAGEADIPLLSPASPESEGASSQAVEEESGAAVSEELSPESVAKAAADPLMSAKVNRIGVRHYLAGKAAQAAKYFTMAVEYDSVNASALLNLAQLYLENARDFPDKRSQRHKMFLRYLRLAERLELTDGQRHKHGQLNGLASQSVDQLPPGALGALLK